MTIKEPEDLVVIQEKIQGAADLHGRFKGEVGAHKARLLVGKESFYG